MLRTASLSAQRLGFAQRLAQVLFVLYPVGKFCNAVVPRLKMQIIVEAAVFQSQPRQVASLSRASGIRRRESRSISLKEKQSAKRRLRAADRPRVNGDGANALERAGL